MDMSQVDHTLFGAVRHGIEGVPIEIQARFFPRQRKPGWNLEITGLPGPEIRECCARIDGAFAKCGFPPPRGDILINLAPAGLPKYGTSLDLPIALISLQAAGLIRDWPPEMERSHVFLGELGLHGDVRRIPGALPAAHAASGDQHLIVPEGNELEAAMIRAVPGKGGVQVSSVGTLEDAVAYARGHRAIRGARFGKEAPYSRATRPGPDFAAVKGQAPAKRALEIAAAGGHNVLMVGPPGEGKSLLASALVGILPPLASPDKVELTKIYSAKGLLEEDGALVVDRPFRVIHHTASRSAMVGGGSGIPEPGEISLAHRGVVFLDELPEFPRSSLEALREPMEAGQITISRVGMTLSFPAQFTFVAAMNPCPCGFGGQYQCVDCLHIQESPMEGCRRCKGQKLRERCTCTPQQVARYTKRISGPLLDRIDMKVAVEPLDLEEKFAEGSAEPSKVIRERVAAARERQAHRYEGTPIPCNAFIPGGQVSRWCVFEEPGFEAYRNAVAKLSLSTRATDKLAKLSRTVADLAAQEKIGPNHVTEAVGLLGTDLLG